MIKKEWIKRQNGFEPGCMVLYIDPTCLETSQVFRLKDLDVETTFHPSTGDTISYVFVVADTSNKYGTPMYLHPEGELYPIESRQFAFWNPGNVEAGNYHTVTVSPHNFGSVVGDDNAAMGTKTVTYSNSTNREYGTVSFEVIDRPDWAPGIK